MTVLIDGDIVLNKACFVGQKKRYFVNKDEFKTLKDAIASGAQPSDVIESIELLPISVVYYAIDSLISNIVLGLNRETFEVVVGDPVGKSFRHHMKTTKPYKGNRKESSRPLHMPMAYKYMMNKYSPIVAKGVEADDILGHMQTEDTIIASIDKDLLQIPGWHYNIDSQESIHASDPGTLTLEPRGDKKVLKGTGFKWFCAQMLMGDITDNYAGVPGMGSVKVYDRLNKCNTVLSCVGTTRGIYEASGYSDEYFWEMATLAHIQRERNQTVRDFIRGLIAKELATND